MAEITNFYKLKYPAAVIDDRLEKAGNAVLKAEVDWEGDFNNTNGTKVGTLTIGETENDKYNIYAPEVKWTPDQEVQEGTKIGTLTIGETENDIYAPAASAGGTAELTDETVLLTSDLYTYYNVGKITGASQTSPKLVASRESSLKDVFNAVFGTQEDTQPYINTDTVKLKVNPGTTQYGGGEYGTVVSSTTVDITFTLENQATANYGYRCGTAEYTGYQTFYYPVTKQSNADLKITLPSGQTASSSMVTAGTFVSTDDNVLYCNFNSDKQVTIRISLDAGNVTASKQTRYGQIKGEVTLGAAQKEDGTAITKFLTYLGNDANEINKLSGGPKSNTAGAYEIKAGYAPYTYCLSASLPSTLPTTNRSQQQPNIIEVSGGSDNTYLYIFVPSGKPDISNITASGFGVPSSKVASSKSYVVKNLKSTTYNVFKTDDVVMGDTFSVSWGG